MNNYAEPTLCWTCRHAVPKITVDKRTGEVKYIRGCPWSIHAQPVKGWDAEERMLPGPNRRLVRSFWVKQCPLFEKGRK